MGCHPQWGRGWCKPIFASRPTGRANRLEACDEIAGWLGHTLWGWQRHVLALATEVDADGVWHRARVAIQVGRQNGKSFLLQVRCILGVLRGEKIAIAAQRRDAAVSIWEAVADTLTALFPPEQVRRINSEGRERIRVTLSNGRVGEVRAITATRTAARSRTFDTIIVDEGAFISQEFIAAIRPTRLTRKGPQVWMVSSAGYEDAIAWRVELFAMETADDQDTVCVVKFGVAEDDGWAEDEDDDEEVEIVETDWGSEAVWWDAIPTLDEDGGVQLAAIRDDWHALSPTDFAREYLGVGGALGQAVMTRGQWIRCRSGDLGDPPRSPNTVVAVDVAPDSSYTAIVAAWLDADDRACAALLSSGTGDDWLLRDLRRAIDNYRPGVIVMDGLCPARAVAGILTTAGYKVDITSTPRYTAACVGFAQLATAGEMSLERSPPMLAAARSAVRRPVGRSWGMLPHPERGPTQPLMAAALAIARAREEPDSPGVSVWRPPGHTPEAASGVQARRPPE